MKSYTDDHTDTEPNVAHHTHTKCPPMEMLDLSRLEAGKVKLSREDFSLPEIIAPVFERLERAIEAKNLVLTLELDENCIINADMA